MNANQSSAGTLFGDPVVQEMSSALNLDKFDFPFVIRDKVLMDAGTWNNHFYSSEEIAKAFNSTDWSNTDVLSLYNEHNDLNAGEWLGQVVNPRMSGDKLVGDLVINDWNFALKMQTGAPRFGVSPRVSGKQLKGTNNVVNFVYENFSIVKNPAVKTTFLNSKSKESFAGKVYLTKTVDDSVKVIKTMSGGSNMAEEDIKKEEAAPEAQPEAEPVPEKKEETPGGEEKAEETAPSEDAKPVEEAKPSEANEELAQKQVKIDALKALLSELEGDVEKKASEVKSAALDAKLSAIESKLVNLEKLAVPAQAEVPDRRSVNAGSVSIGTGKIQAMLSRYKKNPVKEADSVMASFVKDMAQGGVQL